MTSNTAPFGEVSASFTPASGYEAYRAFDGTMSKSTHPSTSSENRKVAYEFPNPVEVRMVGYRRTTNTGTTTRHFKVSYSDDGTNYTDIDTYAENTSEAKITYVNVNSGSHKWWQITAVESGEDTACFIQFWGLDYSEKEFEIGSNKKWLYDHGVELETLTKMEKGTGTATNDGEVYKCSAGNNSAGIGAILDLTSYSLFRAKINNATDGSSMNMACGANVTNNYSIGYIAVPNAALPNNPSYDISSVNQSAYANVYCPSSNKYIDITEFWLE
jgi:hypothetical protein